MDTPSFKEDHISQIPALQMIVNLGHNYQQRDTHTIDLRHIAQTFLTTKFGRQFRCIST